MQFIKADNIQITDGLTQQSTKYHSLYIGERYRFNYIQSIMQSDIRENNQDLFIIIITSKDFIEGYQALINKIRGNSKTGFSSHVQFCEGNNYKYLKKLIGYKKKDICIYIDVAYPNYELCQFISDCIKDTKEIKITMATNIVSKYMNDFIDKFENMKILSCGYNEIQFDEIGGIRYLLEKYNYSQIDINKIDLLLKNNHELEYVFIKGMNNAVFLNRTTGRSIDLQGRKIS